MRHSPAAWSRNTTGSIWLPVGHCTKGEEYDVRELILDERALIGPDQSLPETSKLCTVPSACATTETHSSLVKLSSTVPRFCNVVGVLPDISKMRSPWSVSHRFHWLFTYKTAVGQSSAPDPPVTWPWSAKSSPLVEVARRTATSTPVELTGVKAP